MSLEPKSVVLVGFQDQGNLGLGYLASVLREHDLACEIIDINQPYEAILDRVLSCRPIVIGFSLIFQYYLRKFSALAECFRSKGIDCHMTIGGHYPSLSYEQVLNQIPQLDSVVMFEGEYTLLELVQNLVNHMEWRDTPGIAYNCGDHVILNPLRPLISDLDSLPFPQRSSFESETLGKKIQPILATRGCPRNCSFCSIREFYSRAPGKSVRRRSPVSVVQEMKELYEIENVTIFLFQDDDFPVVGNAGHRWVTSFTEELERNGLQGKIAWKISCRVDEVNVDLFEKMKAAGLYLVYLGIESGTDEGLRTLNKQVSVNDVLKAVANLKQLGLMFAYGFMLFDPSSTFGSVRANVQFLKQIVSDGRVPTTFCKMLPYAGTPIEIDLASTGRLCGTVAQPDYNFLEPELDSYYEKLNAALNAWVYGEDAVARYLSLVWHEVAIIKQLFPPMDGTAEYENDLRGLTRSSNHRVLSAIEQSSWIFERDHEFPLCAKSLDLEARELVSSVLARRNAFIRHNQQQLLTSITCPS